MLTINPILQEEEAPEETEGGDVGKEGAEPEELADTKEENTTE